MGAPVAGWEASRPGGAHSVACRRFVTGCPGRSATAFEPFANARTPISLEF